VARSEQASTVTPAAYRLLRASRTGRITVTIPVSTAAGTHHIVATQGSTSADAALTVTAADSGNGPGSGDDSGSGSVPGDGAGSGSSGDSDALASTGSNVATGVGLGVLALLLGAATLIGIRRRRATAR